MAFGASIFRACSIFHPPDSRLRALLPLSSSWLKLLHARLMPVLLPLLCADDGRVPLPESDPISKFNKAVLALPKDAFDKEVIELTDTIWPSLVDDRPQLPKDSTDDPRRRLFVRSFYGACFKDVMFTPKMTPTRTLNYVVIGQPGIGKSAFGMYTLARLIKDGRTVIYIPKGATSLSDGFLFTGGQVFEASWRRRIRELQSPETVLICDSFRPPSVDAMVILITSPRRDRWYEFAKQSKARLLQFPTFSLAETERMRATCFPHLRAEDVAPRFKDLGGIPRYVLDSWHVSAEKFFEAAAAKCFLRDFEDTLNATSAEDFAATSHRLFHFLPKGQLDPTLSPSSEAFYEFGRVRPASDIAAAQFENRMLALLEHNVEIVHTVLTRCPSLAGVLGVVFERRALNALANGGFFPLWRLRNSPDDKEDLLLHVPKSMGRVLFDMGNLASKVSQHPEALLEPADRNQAAVDAIFPGKVPLQVTVSNKHDISVTEKGLLGVARGLDLMGEKKVVPLVFVVPTSVATDSKSSWTKKQRFTRDGGKPIALRNPPKETDYTADAEAAPDVAINLASRVEQYVLHLEAGVPILRQVPDGDIRKVVKLADLFQTRKAHTLASRGAVRAASDGDWVAAWLGGLCAERVRVWHAYGSWGWTLA